LSSATLHILVRLHLVVGAGLTDDNETVLPHQAGGAISGIEDAEALGACLSGISRDGVNPALQKAFRIRFKRAARFQLLSHDDGIKTKRQPTIKDQMWSWDYTGARRWEAEQPSWVLREGENAVYVLQDL
jgi:2-polyprenyl-6-methoxyphenol hydroxylase-like FAD-dependent oxidoreductase